MNVHSLLTDGLAAAALNDPVEINLSVCREIPGLAGLPISDYQLRVDQWALDFEQRLPGAEKQFWAAPRYWKQDVRFFRLGMLCWFLGEVLGIRYKDELRDLQSVRYTNPADLFLHGLIDTRMGTCGNMPVLYLALAWRLGWPVILIVAGSHALCRFDDGDVSHNIECTNFTDGFRSPPDDYLKREYGIPDAAVQTG